jgi:hypothetical protein
VGCDRVTGGYSHTMDERKLDPVTAEAEAQDEDFAEEHHRPTWAADQEGGPDEATPRDQGGPGGGMDLPPAGR